MQNNQQTQLFTELTAEEGAAVSGGAQYEFVNRLNSDMHTAQLLSHALDMARNSGFQIREEALEGAGGGHYRIKGQKCLLIDLTQTQQEQLDDVLDALRSEPHLEMAKVPRELVASLRMPKAA